MTKTRQCDRCGNTYAYERSTSKFCSTNCRAANASGDRLRVPDDVRFYVLARDTFRCRLCGDTPARKQLRVDHMTPVAEGGSLLDTENLITLCHPCNSGKGTTIMTWDDVPPLED